MTSPLVSGRLFCRTGDIVVIKKKRFLYTIYDIRTNEKLAIKRRAGVAFDLHLKFFEDRLQQEKIEPVGKELEIPKPHSPAPKIEKLLAVELTCDDILTHLDNLTIKAIEQMQKNRVVDNKSPVACDICECDDFDFLNSYETEEGPTILCAICALKTKVVPEEEISFDNGVVAS